MKKLILIFFIFISYLSANNQNIDTNIQLNDTQYIYDDFKLFYIKDKNSTLDINDIQKVDFNQTTLNKYTLGYTKGNLWFKFDITNNSNISEYIISLNETFYEKANLYYYDKNNILIKKENSLFTPIKDRDVKINHLAFDVNIAKNYTTTFYLELNGKYSYFGNISIFKKSYLYENSFLKFNSVFLFIFGVIFIILLFNAFLYIQFREKIFIYYVGYAFFNLMYLLNISGILVYLNLQNYIYTFHISASYTIAYLILFSREYLETKRYLNRFDTILKYISGLFFILGILVIFSYQPWNKVINNLAGLMSISLLVIAIIIYYKGYKKSKYYIFAMMLYLIFIFLFTFMVVGLFEYNWLTRYGYYVAAAIETIMFSLMLSDRYNDLKEETIASQNRLLEIKNQNEAFLEDEIRNRTNQIQQNYNQIKTLLNERDLLLKEVHHRVKNNFHMITGLLWFEEQKNINSDVKFQNLKNRIKSMSMLHEKLYKSEDVSYIQIKDYLEDVISNLLIGYKQIDIKLEKNIENIILEFEYALSIGIIVNETINNSLKHNSNLKEINISIRLYGTDNRIFLTIKDNGIGFDNNTSTDGIGMSLVDSFSATLPNSSYDIVSNNGVEFNLVFTNKYGE